MAVISGKEDMKSRVEKTLERKTSGAYNCAQAVLCTYADLLGLEETDAFKAAAGMVNGMTIGSTCGAVTAMAMAAGYAASDGKLSQTETKKDAFKLTRKMLGEFVEKNSTVLCAELKKGNDPVSCLSCIADAAEIIEREIFGVESGEANAESDSRQKEAAKQEAAIESCGLQK